MNKRKIGFKKTTDLAEFAKLTNEQGGEWWLLKECGRYSLCMCKEKYLCDNRNYYYTTPVYQIFKDGARIYASTNYREAWDTFVKFAEESKRWEKIKIANENATKTIEVSE